MAHSSQLISRETNLSALQTSGGMITDTSVHDFDLARSFLDAGDEPATIHVQGSDRIEPKVRYNTLENSPSMMAEVGSSGALMSALRRVER